MTPIISREALAQITGEDIAWKWLEKARDTYRGACEVYHCEDGTALVRSEHFETQGADLPARIAEMRQALHAKEIGRKAQKLMERALR